MSTNQLKSNHPPSKTFEIPLRCIPQCSIIHFTSRNEISLILQDVFLNNTKHWFW